MYNLREGLARISASSGTSSEPHTKRRVLFCFFFLPSPVLRAPGRVGQHRLLRKLVLRFLRFRAVSGGEGASRERLGRGRRRARELAVGRARARRARGRECAGSVFGRCREGAGRVAARAGEGGRTPRGSCKRPREGIRAYAQCSASCPWPSTRASWWAGSSFSSCGRRTRRSRRERVSDDGARRDGRRGTGEDGRRRPRPNASPRPDRGRVTDFAARTLPRTSPWSPPCAPRSPPAASRDPPSYWRGTE